MSRIRYELQQYQMWSNDEERSHISYEEEKLLHDSVKNADREEFLRLFPAVCGDNMGVMARNRHKQQEYLAVACITVATRAAIEGGLNAYLAYDLSDIYLQHIASVQDPILYLEFVKEYCLLLIDRIRESRVDNIRSLYCSQIKCYIEKHLNEKITLASLSAETGVSENYISYLFSKEEGCTIREYLLRERIEASKHMLQYSDYTIQQIAYLLQFCSQSHYTQMFRRIVGITPSAFRIQYRQNT